MSFCSFEFLKRMPKKHAVSSKVRKRKGKDMDEIVRDLEPEKRHRLLNQEYNLDLPGQHSLHPVSALY
ncbi:unnamed protein product [Gongylonema pulchrum]|uniref:40S ribosomal protein S15 n=1 Tax=Gongylonema pulchrum TaxID=637853 RepID=A0A183DXV5_9BILA|nr:unnamed protein product [Gongylonema pulchrum]